MARFAEISKLWSLDILKAKLKQTEIDSLLKESDEYLKTGADMSPILAGLIQEGEQREFEFSESFDVFPYVVDYLKSSYDPFFRNIEARHLEVRKSWIVSQYAGDYNPVHTHDALLSGILYLKVPKQIQDSFNTIQKNGNNGLDGCLHFIFGNFHVPSLQNLGPRAICPRVGDMYIFPAYIMHTVYPFKGDGERRCIAFNVDLK